MFQLESCEQIGPVNHLRENDPCAAVSTLGQAIEELRLSRPECFAVPAEPSARSEPIGPVLATTGTGW